MYFIPVLMPQPFLPTIESWLIDVRFRVSSQMPKSPERCTDLSSLYCCGNAKPFSTPAKAISYTESGLQMRQSKSRNLENDLYSFFYNFLLSFAFGRWNKTVSGKLNHKLTGEIVYSFFSKTFYCYHSQRPVRIRGPHAWRRRRPLHRCVLKVQKMLSLDEFLTR